MGKGGEGVSIQELGILRDEQNHNGPIWQSKDNIILTQPESPAIPQKEGLHLVVSPENKANQPWTTLSPHELQESVFYAAAAAKVVTEGRYSGDHWANLHGDSHGISVYGRNPSSEEAWGKPVVKDGGEPQQQLDTELVETYQRYLPQWEKLYEGGNIVPFKNGVNELARDSDEYRKEQEKYGKNNEVLVWANDRFSLVRVGNPHLTGAHFVVNPRKDYWEAKGGHKRVWQDDLDSEHIIAVMEMSSVLAALTEIITEDNTQEGGVGLHNPEMHFSANWSKDLLPKEGGGKFALNERINSLTNATPLPEDLLIVAKAEKRSHRIGADQEYGTNTHGHLYLTDSPEKFVNLPSRPSSERPQEWENIIPMPDATAGRLTQLITNGLTQRLEKYLPTQQ